MRKIKTQEKRFRDSLQCRQLLEPVIPTSLGMLTDGIVCVSSKGGKSNLETARNSGEYKQLGGFATHTLGLTWKPQIKDWADFTLTFSVDNITNKKFRYLNGGYGVGRSYRAWLSATF